MFRLTSVVLVLGLFGDELQSRSLSGSQHKPSGVPIAWEFELKFEDPKRIEVSVPGRSQRETYWYVLYTATNTSDTTQRFYPQFQIVTESLDVLNTDMGIHAAVFESIRDRHKTVYKYLVSPAQAITDVKAGTDNALESVAIWRAANLDATNFSIFVTGLSGETRLVSNPAYDASRPETVVKQVSGREIEETVNPRYFTLRKTLQIDYVVPGSSAARVAGAPQRQSTKWIMR